MIEGLGMIRQAKDVVAGLVFVRNEARRFVRG